MLLKITEKRYEKNFKYYFFSVYMLRLSILHLLQCHPYCFIPIVIILMFNLQFYIDTYKILTIF